MEEKQKKQRKPLTKPIFIAVYVSVIAVCIALDQLTKYLIDKATFSGYSASGHELSRKVIPILGNWLTLYWTTNDGATGGLFQNLGWQNWLFFIMTLIGLPIFCWLLWRSRTRSVWGQVAFAFIIGGTIGNAIDRIVFAEKGFFTGEVRDFVRVEGFFGIFNIADSFLVVGVILALLAIVIFDYDSLILSLIKERNEKLKKATVSEANSHDDGDTPSSLTTESKEQQVEQKDENGTTDL